jgi:hypothetical protein
MLSRLYVSILVLVLGGCICAGPDRAIYIEESVREVFTPTPVDEPLDCTAAEYTVRCPYVAYTQRLTIEPITNAAGADPFGRWALYWWAPREPSVGTGVGLTQMISVGDVDENDCLMINGAGDNTGFREPFQICRHVEAGGEQWIATIRWQTFAVAGYSRFQFVTGLVY